MSDINRWFSDSTDAMNHYLEQLNYINESENKPHIPLHDVKKSLAANLQQELFHTNKEINNLDKTRIKHIEPESINEMNTTLNHIEKAINQQLSPSGNMLPLSEQDDAVPYINLLKEVTGLLNTIENLNEARGIRTAAILDMEESGKIFALLKPFKLDSTAFKSGKSIPLEYTIYGENVSPPLRFSCEPKDTKSLALIVKDVNTELIHWVAWNLSAEQPEIPRGVRLKYQGVNSFSTKGYYGPCSHLNETHQYLFMLYALNCLQLHLPEGSTKEQLERVMKPHIIATAELMGTFP